MRRLVPFACSAALAAVPASSGLGAQEQSTTPTEVPRMSVEGHVRGPLGEAMRGLRVDLFTFRGDKPLRHVMTDGEGMFVIGGLDSNRYYELRTSAPNTTRSRRGFGMPTPSEDTRVRVRMRLFAAQTFRGTVEDAAGRPVDGATIQVPLFERGRIHEILVPRARTNAKGEFVVEGVPHRLATLIIWAPGYLLRVVAADSLGKPCKLERVPGPPLRFLKIAKPRGVEVRLSVRRSPPRRKAVNDDPLRGDIVLDPVPLDGEGRCRLPIALPEGDWEVRATSVKYTVYPAVVPIPSPKGLISSLFCEAKPHQPDLPTSTLEGRVVDEGGQPIKGVALAIETSFTTVRPRDIVRTDAHGRFSLPGRLRVGQPFRVVFLDGDRVPEPKSRAEHWRTNGPSVYAKLPKDELFEIRTVRGTRLSGRIKGVQGRALGGQQVALLFFEDATVNVNGVVETRTRADGTFALPPVPTAGIRFALRVGGTVWGRLDLGEQDRERDLQKLVIPVETGGRVRGKVLDGQGKELAGEVVTIANIKADSSVHLIFHSVLTDAQGRFSFVDLMPGFHHIQAGGSGGFAQAWRRVEVERGKEVRIELAR